MADEKATRPADTPKLTRSLLEAIQEMESKGGRCGSYLQRNPDGTFTEKGFIKYSDSEYRWETTPIPCEGITLGGPRGNNGYMQRFAVAYPPTKRIKFLRLIAKLIGASVEIKWKSPFDGATK